VGYYTGECLTDPNTKLKLHCGTVGDTSYANYKTPKKTGM